MCDFVRSGLRFWIMMPLTAVIVSFTITQNKSFNVTLCCWLVGELMCQLDNVSSLETKFYVLGLEINNNLDMTNEHYLSCMLLYHVSYN